MDVKVIEKVGKTELLGMLLTEEKAKMLKKGKGRIYKGTLNVIKSGDFSGKEDQMIRVPGEDGVKRIILVGLGKKKDADAEAVRKAAAAAASEAMELKLKELSVMADTSVKGEVTAITEGAILGTYDFDKYKKKKKTPPRLLNVVSGDLKKAKEEAEKARIASEGTCMARDWVNETSDVMNPVAAADLAKKMGKKHGIKVRVMDKKALKKMGMNLMLSVAAGSKYPPRLVVLEYNKGKGRPVVLVGKGVTFDSGGLNLKPTGYIEMMKMDKGGAMTVLAAMVALARMKAKVNVVGLMGMVENMIGPDATKPGEILKGYAGKTVEMCDTDAEGRMVLADALAYATKRYKPRVVVDLATLTGVVLIVFGEYVAALMATDDKEAEALFKAGEKTFERVWRLPVYKEYEDEMKGEVSDWKNLGYKEGRYAGTITGGAFLKQFVGKTPWLHVDIAGTAWWEKPRNYIPKGGTGFGVRLLVEYLTGGK